MAMPGVTGCVSEMKSVRLTPLSRAVLRTIRNEQDASGGQWVCLNRLVELLPELADGCLNVLVGAGFIEVRESTGRDDSGVKVTAAARNALTKER